MPDYAYFFSYKPETWAQLLAAPGDRTPAVRATVEDAGGELRSLHYTLDTFGGLAIVDAPDADTAATIGLVITASGAFTDVRVQPLVRAGDVVPVLERARDTAAGYRRPGT